jgi:hypothetical protein
MSLTCVRTLRRWTTSTGISGPIHRNTHRESEMVAAIVNRAQRRLAGAGALELDVLQREAARHRIERIQSRLRRAEERILPEQKPMLSQAHGAVANIFTKRGLRIAGMLARRTGNVSHATG